MQLARSKWYFVVGPFVVLSSLHRLFRVIGEDNVFWSQVEPVFAAELCVAIKTGMNQIYGT